MTEHGEHKPQELPEAAYDELRRIAHQLMRHEHGPDTIQATALVHEAYLRLAESPPREAVRSRIALLTRTMRNVLVDRARARNADKRGAGQRAVTLNPELIGNARGSELGVLAVHDALEELQKVEPGLASLAELKIFGGLQDREVAAALETSVRTVERRWRLARAWLQRALGGGGD